MSSVVPASITRKTFSAQASREGDTLLVQLTGEADLDARADLDAFVGDLHQCAQAPGITAVTVDLQKLEFMNSSCFKSLVTWLGRIQEMPAEVQYRVHFRSNPQMLWQRRSLHALRCLAVDLVTVEP
jgi:hypothetical protein